MLASMGKPSTVQPLSTTSVPISAARVTREWSSTQRLRRLYRSHRARRLNGLPMVNPPSVMAHSELESPWEHGRLRKLPDRVFGHAPGRYAPLGNHQGMMLRPNSSLA
jgi:hypothetical protein